MCGGDSLQLLLLSMNLEHKLLSCPCNWIWIKLIGKKVCWGADRAGMLCSSRRCHSCGQGPLKSCHFSGRASSPQRPLEVVNQERCHFPLLSLGPGLSPSPHTRLAWVSHPGVPQSGLAKNLLWLRLAWVGWPPVALTSLHLSFRPS